MALIKKIWKYIGRCLHCRCVHLLTRNKPRILAMLVGLSVLLLLPKYYPVLKATFTRQDVVERPETHVSANVNWNSHLQQVSTGADTEGAEHVSDQKCVHPTLNQMDPAVMQYYRHVNPVDCSSAMRNWIYVSNGRFHIARDAIKSHGNITCTYIPILRNGDFKVKDGPRVKPMLDGTPLTSDFFKVTCVSDTGKTYTNVHAAVARNTELMDRLYSYKSLNNHKDADSIAQVSNSFNLSIFMFGFDSLSRMAWQRHLPKSRQYFLDILGGIELDGYNIMGDGTPAALLPILTGKTEAELPEARRGFSGSKPVDNHPWIWKEFSKHGYVTAFGEDMQNVGTVQYRMLGFTSQPTDHFMRPFHLAASPTYGRQPTFCLGSTPRHIVFMNWFRDLFDMYSNVPKFFFGFYGELSHDNNNLIQAADNDLLDFLKELDAKGYLNSTLLILMADHGARFSHVRATAQGKLEERMPYFSFRFPPWFHKRYPDIIRNVRTNSKRLTCPFDIHATFLDILHFSSGKNAEVRNRAISVFKQIPSQRTCTDAEIFPHWCACLEWQTVNKSDPRVLQAVDSAIRAINSYTEAAQKRCAKLALLEITSSFRYLPKAGDLSAEGKEFNYAHGRRPSPNELYEVSFKTSPGQGHFEATCKLNATSRAFSVDPADISRINKYGSQPVCIAQKKPHLRPYCYCV